MSQEVRLKNNENPKSEENNKTNEMKIKIRKWNKKKEYKKYENKTELSRNEGGKKI